MSNIYKIKKACFINVGSCNDDLLIKEIKIFVSLNG